MKTIAVVYPHIATLDWLAASIASHRRKASGRIEICVVDMTWPEAEHRRVREALKGIADQTVWLRVNPARYHHAEALEIALPLVASVAVQDVIVISDSDVLMLRQGWDTRVIELLQSHEVVSANPRGGDFAGMVEWNWMAFKRGDVVSFSGDDGLHYHDWGHHVTAHLRGGQYLFGCGQVCFPGKAAAIAGDADGPWIFHSFYATSVAVGDNRDGCLQGGLAATSGEIEMIKGRYDLLGDTGLV